MLGDSSQAAYGWTIPHEPLGALLWTVPCLFRGYAEVYAAGLTHGSTQVIKPGTEDTGL
jgi:hypothetical protein